MSAGMVDPPPQKNFRATNYFLLSDIMLEDQ